MQRTDLDRRALIAADAVALAAFVLVGLASHHDAGGLRVLLRNLIPLEVSWFAVASAVGAYRRPGFRTLVLSWVVAVPAALLVRSAWVGSPTGSRLAVFMGVGLAFTLLFLVCGRLAVRAIGRRGPPTEA